MKQMSLFTAVIKFGDNHQFHGYGVETQASTPDEMTRENSVFRSYKCFPNHGHPLMGLRKRRINATRASFNEIIVEAKKVWMQSK